MKKEQTVAYLDLLAFSSHVRDNLPDALMAFTTYSKILETKLKDNSLYPPTSYTDQISKDCAKKMSVDSFSNFLPFSDSIFITSEEPNLFIKQLGTFVLRCFKFALNTFDYNTFTKYPTLFRGGIAIGEAIPIELIGIVKGKQQIIPNIAGEAVVKAVALEQKVKGPRIVFGKDFFEKLDKSTKVYISETKEDKDLYELGDVDKSDAIYCCN